MPTEGRTDLASRVTGKGAGPGTKDADAPFYNPAMALNRDLTLLTITAHARLKGRELDIADALCGAGARTLRIANEVPHPLTVHANDRRPDALAALREGVRLNGITGRIETHRGDAEAFLASRRFDVVDVDPYGSPAPFMDAAMRATRHGGLLCLTATDTAALSGTYPRVCRRRYDFTHHAHALPWRAEVGLRGLLGALVRSAGRRERGIEPVWSVSQGHWMRAVVKVRDGAPAADAGWRNLAWVAPDERGGGAWHRVQPEGQRFAGPLWKGPLHDPDFVQAMRDATGPGPADGASTPPSCAEGPKVDRLLATMAQEAGPGVPAFWVDLDALAGRGRGTTPRTRDALDRLRAAGYVAAPTHMSSKGVRTDAPLDALHGTFTAKPS